MGRKCEKFTVELFLKSMTCIGNIICYLLAPLMALFTVPVIGHWSDICTSKWGRRRPFIFVLSLFLVLSLMLLCFGQNLVTDPERRHNG